MRRCSSTAEWNDILFRCIYPEDHKGQHEDYSAGWGYRWGRREEPEEPENERRLH